LMGRSPAGRFLSRGPSADFLLSFFAKSFSGLSELNLGLLSPRLRRPFGAEPPLDVLDVILAMKNDFGKIRQTRASERKSIADKSKIQCVRRAFWVRFQRW
jgi:hypothetical protein